MELEALKLRNPIATQIEALNELMGRPVNTPFRTVGVEQIAEERMDPEEAIQKALSQRPEVRQASLRVQQADLDVRVKRSEYIPDVSLALTYGSAFNFQNALPQNVATAGVLLRLGGVRLGPQEAGDEREAPHGLAGAGGRRSSRSPDPCGSRASAPAVRRGRSTSEGEHTVAAGRP